VRKAHATPAAHEDLVVLVDTRDRVVGTAPKGHAHRHGQLHRAFSVFLFDRRGRVLLQLRAHSKYHSPGLWSNACCCHPRPGESILAAAHRRLAEELGIRTHVRPAFAFVYRADVGNGLIEHEYDHVLVGCHDGAFEPCPAEVAQLRLVDPHRLAAQLARAPSAFTRWLPIAFRELVARGLLPGTSAHTAIP
jgi:isopentenyl-diphosphate delta-isomerase